MALLVFLGMLWCLESNDGSVLLDASRGDLSVLVVLAGHGGNVGDRAAVCFALVLEVVVQGDHDEDNTSNSYEFRWSCCDWSAVHEVNEHRVGRKVHLASEHVRHKRGLALNRGDAETGLDLATQGCKSALVSIPVQAVRHGLLHVLRQRLPVRAGINTVAVLNDVGDLDLNDAVLVHHKIIIHTR